jgi:hypothetical protein
LTGKFNPIASVMKSAMMDASETLSAMLITTVRSSANRKNEGALLPLRGSDSIAIPTQV